MQEERIMSDDVKKMQLNDSLKGTDGTMLEVGFALANVLDVVTFELWLET